MKKILCMVLLFVFMPFFLNAQAEIHQDDANDESAEVEHYINLLESTMNEWQESTYPNKLGSCRIVVVWTYFFRVTKPELLKKIAIEIENKSMETTNHYAEKCVIAVDNVAEQEARSRSVNNVVIESLVKIGLIPPENAHSLYVNEDQ